MSKKLFISHSTKDDAQVDRIANALEAAGFTVWVDHRHGIEPGTPNWDRAIRDAIVEADAGIFLMSENSLKSEICGAECLLVRELEDPLYVMRLEACKPENIWLYIKQIQYADLVKDFDKGINDLIRVLVGETSEELPKAVRAAFTGLDTMRLYLPYLNNPLRGRDEDIKQIQSKLGAHVLQIVGPGGLGKTRLAAEIAMNQSDGAIWHRCSPVSEPADLVALLREHLKLPADANLTNVLAVLSDKKSLIVVDNAEDVPDGSDKRRAYADLLQQIVGRGVSTVLTTRAVWTELKPRREYAPAAVSLEIAAQIALDFAVAEDVELSEGQARELAEKARLHPRLIEFSVGQLHERSLERVLRQLSGLKHGDIKEALDEMITKTVEQMAAQAKHGADAEALLRRMTILQATFPLDAIRAIAPDGMQEDTDRLEDALVTLQRWQFVRRDVSTERYSLGDLVRDALGQPDDDVFLQYATYYTVRARDIFSLPQEKWRPHEFDFPNILALGDRLVERIPHLIQTIDEQAENEKDLLFIASAFAMNTIKFVAYRWENRREAWLSMGLTVATNQDYVDFKLSFLNALGLIWSKLGDIEKAKGFYKQVLSLARTTGLVMGEVSALIGLGAASFEMGRYQNAQNYFKRALKLNQGLHDQTTDATILNHIGLSWSSLGNKGTALEYLEEALHTYHIHEDLEGEATVLHNKGSILFAMGEKQKAINCLEQALSIYAVLGNRMSEMSACRELCAMNVERGEIEQGIAYMTRCVELGEQLDSPSLGTDREILDLVKQI